jgi:hypothetical protein
MLLFFIIIIIVFLQRPDGPRAHPASYPIDNGALSLVVKRPEREATVHPHLFLKLRMPGAIPQLPIRLYDVVPKHRENFIFVGFDVATEMVVNSSTS